MLQNIIEHNACRNGIGCQIVLDARDSIEVFEVLVGASFRESLLVDFRTLHFDHNVNNSDLGIETFLKSANIIRRQMDTFNHKMLVTLLAVNPVLNYGRQMLMDQFTLTQIVLETCLISTRE